MTYRGRHTDVRTLASALTALTFAVCTFAVVPAYAEIVVGVAAPASGREQKTGEAIRQAAEKTVADVNAKGGVLGEKLTLAVMDDQCSDEGAIAAANAFIQKQARLIIGHPCTRAALAAAGVYGPAGVIFMATSNRHPALTDKRAGKTIFRLSGRDDQQAAAAAAWLLNQQGTAPFAIVHDKTAYSRGLAAGVSTALAAKAQAVPLALPITAGENDYAAVIAKLKEVKPRALFFAGYPAEADIIVSAVRASGLTMPVLGSESLATKEFTVLRAASDPFMLVLARFNPKVEVPSGVEAGDTGLSAPLRASADHAASAILTWAAAANRAASKATEAVTPQLAAKPAELPAGTVLFDEKGDAMIASFYPARWSGTRWVEPN